MFPSVSAVHRSVSGTRCDGKPFSNMNIAVQCNGGTNCRFGDNVTVSGHMYATGAFDDEEVTLRACVGCALGRCAYCPDDALWQTGSLCEDWLTPTGGQNCGESGTYDVSHTEVIPENDEIPSSVEWVIQTTIQLSMIVGDEDECQSQADENGNSTAVSMSILPLALLGACMLVAKSRQHQIEEEGEDDARFTEMDESDARFTEMAFV
ncbi:hypothetical protein ACHAWF_001548 [Thalassiosira exigua]